MGRSTRGGEMLVTVIAPLDLPTTPLDDDDGLLFDTVLVVPFGGVLICWDDDNRVILL